MNELQRYYSYLCGKYSRYNTRRGYIQNARTFLNYIDKPVDKLVQDDLDKFADYCYQHRKTNTNAVSFWCINKFLHWTGRKDLSLPAVTQIDAGKTALDGENTQQLMDSVEQLSPLHQLVFYLEYDAIRRPDEIRKLKTTDRYGDILRYDGKRKTIPNKVVMTDRLMQAWDDYLQVRPIPVSKTDDKYLILSDYGQFKGKHLKTYTRISRTIKEVCLYSKVQIPNGEKPSNYLIKRTSISRQLKQCPDPKIIQLQAGHSKLETTMKYNRVSENDIRNYVETLNDKSGLINKKPNLNTNKKHLTDSVFPQSLNKTLENDSFSFSIISFFETATGVGA